MTGRWYSSFAFYFVAPFVATICLLALSVTGLAAYENFKLGQVTDQIVQMVSLARDMKMTPDIPADKAAYLFFERLKAFRLAEVVETPSSAPAQPLERGVKTPWGDVMQVTFYPEAKSFRLETRISSTFCRRVLLFYAADAASIGLRRVDVRNAEGGAIWRQIYEEEPKGGALSSDAIHAGCGSSGDDILSLTFFL